MSDEIEKGYRAPSHREKELSKIRSYCHSAGMAGEDKDISESDEIISFIKSRQQEIDELKKDDGYLRGTIEALEIRCKQLEEENLRLKTREGSTEGEWLLDNRIDRTDYQRIDMVRPQNGEVRTLEGDAYFWIALSDKYYDVKQLEAEKKELQRKCEYYESALDAINKAQFGTAEKDAIRISQWAEQALEHEQAITVQEVLEREG